jgi:hypothetical protein
MHGSETPLKLDEPFQFKMHLVDREQRRVKKNQMFSKLLGCDGFHFVVYVGPANDNVSEKNYCCNTVFYGPDRERRRYRWQVALSSKTEQLNWGGTPVTCKAGEGTPGTGLTKERVCHTQSSKCKGLLLTKGVVMCIATKDEGKGRRG